MANPQDEDHEPVVFDLVDDPIVAGADPPFATATHQLDGAWRPGVIGEQFEDGLDSPSHRSIELA